MVCRGHRNLLVVVSRRSVFSMIGGIAFAGAAFLGGPRANAQEIFVGASGSQIGSHSFGALLSNFGPEANASQTAFGPVDGDLHAANSARHQVRRYNVTIGAFVQPSTAPGTAGTITPFSRTGSDLGIFAASSTGAGYPTTLANSDIPVARFGNNVITRSRALSPFRLAAPRTTSMFANTSLNGPVGMALGTGSRLHVANSGSNSITRYNGVALPGFPHSRDEARAGGVSARRLQGSSILRRVSISLQTAGFWSPAAAATSSPSPLRVRYPSSPQVSAAQRISRFAALVPPLLPGRAPLPQSTHPRWVPGRVVSGLWSRSSGRLSHGENAVSREDRGSREYSRVGGMGRFSRVATGFRRTGEAGRFGFCAGSFSLGPLKRGSCNLGCCFLS